MEGEIVQGLGAYKAADAVRLVLQPESFDVLDRARMDGEHHLSAGRTEVFDQVQQRGKAIGHIHCGRSMDGHEHMATCAQTELVQHG